MQTLPSLPLRDYQVRIALERRVVCVVVPCKPQPPIACVRAVVNPEGFIHWWDDKGVSHVGGKRCPLGPPKSVLVCKEACRAKELTDAEAEAYFAMRGGQSAGLVKPEYGLDGVLYLADDTFIPIENSRAAADRWCDLHAYRGKRGAVVPPKHMPLWASRLSLAFESVRVAPVQEITLSEIAETGAPPTHPADNGWDSSETFREMFDAQHGKGAWAGNCWAWIAMLNRVVNSNTAATTTEKP